MIVAKPSRRAPLSLEPHFIKGVRDALLSAGYEEETVLRYLDAEESITVSNRQMPRLLKMTNRGTPLDAFLRLFFFCVAVDFSLVRKAVAPMTVESWRDGGLLETDGDTVISPMRLAPTGKLWVVFDPSPRLTGRAAGSDHVHGVGYTSINLINATMRRHFRTVLDLGTGCGIQGLLCSDHSDQVISTDINSRALNIAAFNAAINRIENIEFRKGNLFEPIRENRFDLIIMNPPFVISPDSLFSYRDNSRDGDGFVKELIQAAPDHLNEGGFFQMIAQWAHLGQSTWQDRLSGWFEGTECDAWALKIATQSPSAYAINWIAETEDHDSSGYVEQWNRWTDFYEKNKIEAVSTGIINLRRRISGPYRYWFHEDADRVDESAGEDIFRFFELKDFLAGTSNEELLETPLKISADVRLDHFSRSNGEGWHPDRVILRRTKGVHYAGNLDGRMTGVLGLCNGQRTLAELTEILAKSLGVKRGRIADSFLSIIRGFIERGYLLPPGFD